MSGTATESSPWHTVDEIATELKCTRRHVLNMIHRGDLKAYKFGRLYRVHARDLTKAVRPVLSGRAMER